MFSETLRDSTLRRLLTSELQSDLMIKDWPCPHSIGLNDELPKYKDGVIAYVNTELGLGLK